MIPVHATKARSLNFVQVLLLGILGIVPYYSGSVLSAIWLGVFLLSFAGFTKNRMNWVWYGIAASPGLEVWSRMAKAPYIPDEIGKYYLAWCILLLLIHNIRRASAPPQHRIGDIVLLFLLPGSIVALAHFNYEQWVFNALGIFEICLLLMFAARERWEIENFCRTLQFSLLSIVLMLIFLTIKSPNIFNIEYKLGANSQASGGFGSNQVSTILGAGVSIAVLLQLLHRPLFTYALLNYMLIAYLSLRGLLTFSRGGMIVAMVTILIAMSPYIFANIRSAIKYSLIIIGIALAGLLVFKKANDISGNMLLYRYQGETYSTLSGKKEKNWDVVLTGRGRIASSDWLIFKDNVLFGAGPGGGKRLREDYGYHGSAAHTEATRLMSEHGVGGIIAFLCLLVFPFLWLRRQRIPQWKGIIAALFALSFLTTFHAAVRTNTSIVFYVLAAIPVLLLAREENKTENAG
jgi:hypothetical protein